MSTHEAHETGSGELEGANAGESWMEQGIMQRYKYSDTDKRLRDARHIRRHKNQRERGVVRNRETKERPQERTKL